MSPTPNSLTLWFAHPSNFNSIPFTSLSRLPLSPPCLPSDILYSPLYCHISLSCHLSLFLNTLHYPVFSIFLSKTNLPSLFYRSIQQFLFTRFSTFLIFYACLIFRFATFPDQLVWSISLVYFLSKMSQSVYVSLCATIR